jgi:hypothetical protein
MDDLKTLSASEINATLEGSVSDGTSVVLNLILKIENALSLESKRIGSDGWMKSEWFGEFYSTETSWVYNSRLGWLYVLPDSQNGFWFWDSNSNAWWWSRHDAFPYIYVEKENSPKWMYLRLDSPTVQTYDFTTQIWSIRP